MSFLGCAKCILVVMFWNNSLELGRSAILSIRSRYMQSGNDILSISSDSSDVSKVVVLHYVKGNKTLFTKVYISYIKSPNKALVFFIKPGDLKN